MVLAAAMLLAAGGELVEAVLFRGLFDLAHELHMTGQRLGAMVALLVLVTALLLLEGVSTAGVLRLEHARFLTHVMRVGGERR